MADKALRVTIDVNVKHKEAITQLVNELDRVADRLPKAAKGAKQWGDQAEKSGKKARAGGRHLQNFSFQMQDIIVQTSGGTDVMRSLSQQLPQMLIGFGALGAVVGVVAAGLPILIQLFSDTEDEVLPLSESMEALSESMSSVFATTKTVNMKPWIDEWNKATKAVRDTMLALSEFDLLIATRAFEDSLESLGEESGKAFAASWTEGFASINELIVGTLEAVVEGQNKKFADIFAEATEDDIAEKLGINQQSLDLLRELVRLFDDAEISVDKYSAGLQFLIAGNRGAAQSIIQLEKESRKLIATRDNLAASQAKLEEAGGLGPDGKLTGGSAEKVAKLPNANKIKDLFGPGREQFKIQQEALKETQRLYSALYPEAVKYQQAVLDLNAAKAQGIISEERYNKELEDSKTAYETAINGTTLATQATDIFIATFDTAVNGVAQGTQSMSEAFENMTKAILLQVGKLLAITAIGNSLKGSGGFLGQVGAALLAEKGAVVSGGRHLTAYAKGGVVNSPTVFPMSGGGSGSFGLMGESGSEAVLPLSRMSNGNLGVESSGMNVVINNNAPGVDVRPRQTEDGLTIDVVMSAVSQAVRRGGNEVSESFEASYALSRGRAVYGN